MRRVGAGVAGLALFATCLTTGCRDRRSLEELERVIGTVQDAPPPRGDDPLLARYQHVERIFARNLSPVDLAERVRGEPGIPVERSVYLDSALCYVVAAVAEPDRVQLDLVLHDPGGEERAADRSPDAFPVLSSFCPGTTGHHTLRLSVRGESAELLWNVWPVRDDPESHRSIDALRRTWAEAGHAEGPVHRSILAEGGTLDVPVALLPGACYAVVARSESETADLDLAILDARRSPLQRDLALDGTPALPRFCPEVAEMHYLRFTMFEGQGPFHWQVFRLPRS